MNYKVKGAIKRNRGNFIIFLIVCTDVCAHKLGLWGIFYGKIKSIFYQP